MRDGERLPNSIGDEVPASSWMTLQELAAVRSSSKGSAIRLAKRHRWKRHQDEEGVVRILVPYGVIRGAVEATSAPASSRRAPGAHSELPPAVKKRVEAAERRAERAEARAREAEELRAAAEADATRERQRALWAEAAMETERARWVGQEAVQVDRAVEITMKVEAAQLRHLREAAAARRSMSRWQRLVVAWRGD
jgi:hypothetical protein